MDQCAYWRTTQKQHDFEVDYWDHCDQRVVNWTAENKSIKVGGNGQSSLDTHSGTQMQVC